MNCMKKLLYTTIILTFSGSFLFSIPWVEFNNKSSSGLENNSNNLLFKRTSFPYGATMGRDYRDHYVLNRMHEHDFAKMFAQSDEKEILNSHELYIYPAFIHYLQTLSEYKDYILALSRSIKENQRIRKKTAFVSGFYFETNIFGKLKSGFHDFIHNQAAKILAEQEAQKASLKKGTLRIQASELHNLVSDYSTQVSTLKIKERISAINRTLAESGACHDYSACVVAFGKSDKYAVDFNNMYGTELDYQLHKELCETRQQVFDLENKYYTNHHVKTIAPAIYYYAAQAKKEKDVQTAFQLSDFCYTLTQVLSCGMTILYEGAHSVGKGFIKGAQTFATLDHWKDMARGAVQLALCFTDAIGQEESLHYSLALARSSSDPDALSKFYQQYHLHAKAEADAIHEYVNKTYNTIRSMSWQDVIENGSEVGTTMILDTLALHALSGFTRANSKAFIQELNHSVESGRLFTEQHAVEVAGFGKMVVEEEIIIKETRLAVQLGNNTIKKMRNLGFKQLEDNVWRSPAGLIYKADKKFGNRINHVLAHTKTNLLKKKHSVFNFSDEKVLQLIDEAWIMKGNSLESDTAVYLINMKKIVGINGESVVKIVVIPGTSEVITAYPV